MSEEEKQKPELKPASENPWYILATIAGEPEDWSDTEIIEQNCHYWNGFMRKMLSDKEIEASELYQSLPQLSDKEFAQVEKALISKGFSSTHLINEEEIHFSFIDFHTYVDFSKCVFVKSADFRSSTFSGYADFSSSTFSDSAYFISSTFSGYAYFQSATFKSTTVFLGSTFKHVPKLYETMLYEDTDWHGVIWPSKPEDEETARASKRAYQRLALIMSKLEKPTDKHFFFRKEMEAQRVEDWFSSSYISWAASKAFSVICDYGFGVGRALGWWLGHMVAGATLLFAFCFNTGPLALSSVRAFLQSLKYSFANAHSFLGLNRVFFSDELKVLKEKGNLLAYGTDAGYAFNVIGAIQAVLGVIFLFFLLLTIRNRFRMK